MFTTNSFNHETHLAITPGTYSVEVDDGIVILNFAQERYYGLEDIGQRIWTLIKQGANLGEIHQKLLDEYEISSDVLWQDLCRVVQEMLEHGLVKIDPDRQSPTIPSSAAP